MVHGDADSRSVCVCARTGVTCRECLVLAEFFKKADADGSGAVTVDELTEFLIEKAAGKRRVARDADNTDAGGNGAVSYADYASRQTYGFDQSTFIDGGP